MKDLLVEVTPRESFGKNESRRMRRAGKIPAILYGANKDPVPLVVDPSAIEQILHSESGGNTLFRLGLAGTEKQRHVMINHSKHHSQQLLKKTCRSNATVRNV